MEKRSSKMLELRRKRKARKPTFLRQDAHKKAKLSKNWRKPRGLHNKMRLQLRGYRRQVSVGFKSPAAVRGLSRDGLVMVVVHSPQELTVIDPKTQCIIIGRTVGTKKRLAIVNEAVAKKLRILNLKSPETFVKSVEEGIAKRREEKAKTVKAEKKKEEAKKEEAAKAEQKEEAETLDEIASQETKKDEEKKERDRVLTKKV